MAFAGDPTAVTLAGISLVITAPAPIIDHSPIFTDGITATFGAKEDMARLNLDVAGNVASGCKGDIISDHNIMANRDIQVECAEVTHGHIGGNNGSRTNDATWPITTFSPTQAREI